ncbi:MAG: hypothetical protein AAB518_00680, partial [Patescibacteria group bacterium]
QPEKLELATEATKKAFLERLVQITKDKEAHGVYKNEQSRRYEFEDGNFSFAYFSDPSPDREVPLKPDDVVGEFSVLKTVGTDAVAYQDYEMKRNGAMEHYMSFEKASKPGDFKEFIKDIQNI